MTSATNREAIDELIARHRLPEPIFVTRPAMPPLEEYVRLLEPVWESRWLTNDGEVHRELERALCEYLGVERLSLFCNGTIALLVALQALGVNTGEVITTPFTFPATPHVLHWNGVRPVFCDIDERTCNLDPEKVEAAITPETKAILPVHVYGTPCDTEALQEIADRHGLYVIYDATHVDTVVLVVSVDNARRETIQRAVKLLDSANANIAGVVLNGLEPTRRHYYYYYYYYDDGTGRAQRRWYHL